MSKVVGVEQAGSWRGARIGHDLRCPAGVAAAIASAAFENYRRFSRGGLEIGGVLLGRRTESGLTIEQWFPIACDHAQGPAFLLSAADEQTLEAALGHAAKGETEILGWFVSHSRSELELTEADIELSKRFFPHPWQVALVVKPAADFSVRGRIFSFDGSQPVSGPDFPLNTLGPPQP